MKRILEEDYEADDGFNYKDVMKITEALKKKGFDVHPADIACWYQWTDKCKGKPEKAEKAFKKLLGKDVYLIYDSLARLPQKIEYELGLRKSNRAGGVIL